MFLVEFLVDKVRPLVRADDLNAFALSFHRGQEVLPRIIKPAINATQRGTPWRSRSRPHTEQWCGHSRIFQSRPHSGSLYAPILRSSRIVLRACGRHPDMM